MQTKSDITQNPTKFAEKLLLLIVNETEESCKLLISCIKKAETNYGKPVQSKYTGWFYGQFRLRGNEVDAAREEMEHIPTAYQRALDFQSLIKKGEWNKNSSFNYFLFVELIKAVPGYMPLETKRYPELISVLKAILTFQIKDYINDHKANIKSSQKTNEELAILSKSKLQPEAKVFITNCLITAKAKAIKEKDSTLFCLIKDHDEDWYFAWVDSAGEKHPMKLSNEALSFLLNQKISDISELQQGQVIKLKRECIKVKEAFLAPLAKIKVVINPAELIQELSNDILLQKGMHSTFVLYGKPNEYQLWWVNCWGKASQLSLNTLPELMEFLNTTDVSEKHIIQLKAYLLHVNTRQAVGDEVKQGLSDRLLNPKKPTKQEDLNPKPLDMDLFSNLEKCLANRLGEKKKDKVIPNQLDLSQFAAVSTFFSQRPKENTDLAASELLIMAKDTLQDMPLQINEKVKPGSLNLNQYSAVSSFFGQRPKENPYLAMDELPMQVDQANFNL